MIRIIFLGAVAIALALVADAYVSDPNVAQVVSPYAALAPTYAPSPVEGRAAFVDFPAPAGARGNVGASDNGAPASKNR
jgi:hypothetical protein